MIYVDAHDCPRNAYRMILLKHSQVYYQVIGHDPWHEGDGHMLFSGRHLYETNCGQCETPMLLINHDTTYTRFDDIRISWDELLADPAAVILEVLL